MGQNISKACAPPPLSLRDCIVNGKIDLTCYRLYTRRHYDHEYEQKKLSSTIKRKLNESQPKPKSARSVKRHVIQLPNHNGTAHNASFKDSAWYNLCMHNILKSKKQLKKFKQRFRLPYDEFLKMIEELKIRENLTDGARKIAFPPFLV